MSIYQIIFYIIASLCTLAICGAIWIEDDFERSTVIITSILMIIILFAIWL